MAIITKDSYLLLNGLVVKYLCDALLKSESESGVDAASSTSADAVSTSYTFIKREIKRKINDWNK